MTFQELSNSFSISLKSLYSLKPQFDKPVFIDIYRVAITNKLEKFTFKLNFLKGMAEYVE